MDSHFDFFHWLWHAISISAIIATLAGLFPAIAALAAVIWYGIQIFESDTFQKYIDKVRTRRKLARLSRLKAEHKMLVAEIDALSVVREARNVAAEKVAVAASEAQRMMASEVNAKQVAKVVNEIVAKS